jgi:hypothetical protein
LAGWIANNDWREDLARVLLENYLGRAPTPSEWSRLELLGWLYDYVCLLWSELYLRQPDGAAARPGAAERAGAAGRAGAPGRAGVAGRVVEAAQAGAGSEDLCARAELLSMRLKAPLR